MRSRSRITIALLMLAVFLASLGVSAFNSKRLVHELEHDRHITMAVVDHDHAPPLSTNDSSDSEPLSDSEHRLLHALSYCQPLPGATIAFSWDPPVRAISTLSSLPVLPPAELEPPFRPPRAAALI